MSMLKLELGTLAAVVLTVCPLLAQGYFQANQYTQQQQTYPAVAMNDSGAFVVVWRSHPTDGRGGGVCARLFEADGTASTDEFKINATEVDVDSWTPAVAMNPSGGFVIVWVAACNGSSAVVARMFDAQGLPTMGEFQVSASRDAAQSSPRLAMNSSGSFVIVWTNWYGDAFIGRQYVAARLFGADGSALGGEFFVNGLAQEDWPDVAMDDSGRFVVSWIRMGDTHNRPYGEYIMFRRFEADGRPVGNAFYLTDDLNSRWYGPAVACDRQGGFVVTWAVGPYPYNICAQGFDSTGAPMTNPYIVNSRLEGNQGRPTIAGDGQGDYLIAWDCQSVDGVGCSVSAQLCTCDGQFRGRETVLDVPACYRQWYPHAAMASDGQYVVVWTGQTEDGSGYDVFGQFGSL
jgi:hypothetical protein